KLHFIDRTRSAARAVAARKAATPLSSEQTQLLDALWMKILDLGRYPFESELDNGSELAESFGSYRSALKAVKSRYEADKLSEAGAQRRNELLVMLAIHRLRKTRSPLMVDTRLRNDIDGFFGGVRSAHQNASQLIASLRHEERFRNAVEQACEQG